MKTDLSHFLLLAEKANVRLECLLEKLECCPDEATASCLWEQVYHAANIIENLGEACEELRELREYFCDGGASYTSPAHSRPPHAV